MESDWMTELDTLLERFPDAANADTGTMALDELWGSLQSLRQRAEEC